MKLLLDTHTFIWWDDEPERLSRRAREALDNRENTICLSVVSVWELQIKAQLGKLELPAPLPDLLTAQLQNGLEIVPISIEDVLELANLPPIHRDPFDRLLVAQARRGGFRLVSRDPLVTQYEVAALW